MSASLGAARRDGPPRVVVARLAAAVAVAALGLVFHNAKEFGPEGLLAAETGTVPFVLVLVGVFLLWWRVRPLRTGALWAPTGLAVVSFSGAVLTVLPLGILPFSPEQSLDHYVSHLVYAPFQAPLIVLALREAVARRQ